MVARFGGDEFAVIATDLIETPSVSRLAQRIIASLNKPFLINGNEIRCGVSVGIALFSRNVQDVTTLLSRADIALYRAKDDGRGVFRFFTDAMDRDVRERFVLGGELRDAIDAGQLCLQYQPQVDGQNGVLIGMEALVRWQHPARGLIGPNIFIPISEQIGLAVALGRWVMREACRQTREWLDEGLNPPRIAINVSGQQFKTPGEIETDLDLALFDYGLTAERFELELTESVLMDQSLEHFEALLRLTKAGFRLAIDDFGTGYSSLGYLRRFKVNRIKIAQEFVKDIKENLGDLAIVKATIGLAHALNVEVIAEGVETAQHRDLLEQWGCREMQGYYFARPLPPKQIAALLRSGETLPCP